jgi:SOS-response transcriptional repressor LexA
MKGLTRRQWNVMTFIQVYRARSGFTPTYQEISDGCGIPSTSCVADDIDALLAMRLISRRGEKCRTLVVLDGVMGLEP